MIATTLIPDALARERTYTDQPYRPGVKVRDIIEDLGGQPQEGERWLAIRGGRRCSLDEELSINDDLVIARFPSGVVEFIVFAVISSLLSFGLSILINALMGPPSVPKQSGPDGASYGFGGIRNTRTQGTPIAVVYGTHRVGGQILTLYKRNEDADSTVEFLYMLIGLSAGQLNKIGHLLDDADGLSNAADFEELFTTSTEQPLNAREGWRSGPLTPIDPTPDAYGITNLTSGRIERTLNIQETFQVHWIDDIGLGISGWTISYELVGAATGNTDLWLAFNAIDRDNYAFVRPRFNGGDPDDDVEIGHVISGSETILATYNVGVDHLIDATIRVERIGNKIETFLASPIHGAETSLGTVTATPLLSGLNIGFHAEFLGGGAVSRSITAFHVATVNRLPDGMHINGNEANQYKNVTAHVRLGRPTNRALPAGSGFEKIIQGYNIDLPTGTAWTTYIMREEVQGFQMVFQFPRGLFINDPDDGLVAAAVPVEIEYRKNSGFDFTPIPGSPFTFVHKLTTNFSRTVFHEPVIPLFQESGLPQQVRFRRTTAEAVDNPLVNDNMVLGSFNEVTTDTSQTYDDIALVALRIEANENLSGAIPNVTSLVQGIPVPTWDGVAGGAATPEIIYNFSNNTAWVALNILLDKQFGLGNWVELADIDMQSFYDWSVWNGEQLTYAEAFDEPIAQTDGTEAVTSGSNFIVIDDATESLFLVGSIVRVELERVNQVLSKVDLGGGRTRIDLLYPVAGNYPARFTFSRFLLGEVITDIRNTFDGVFDGELSAWEALLRVCRAGRAVPVKEGRKWRIRFEDEDPVAQVISDSNIVKGSLEVSYAGTGDEPDIMEAQYLDAILDFDQNVVTARGFPIDPKRLPRRDVINLYGVTRERQARREANFRLRAMKLLRRQIKFRLLLDGLATESGDVIKVGLSMPGWTVWSGRVRGSTAAFVIDSPVTIPVNANAIIRNDTDRAGTQVAITNPPGDYPAGSTIVTNASPDDPIVGDATVLIVAATTAPTLWRVTRVSIGDDLTAAVEAIQYNPDAYLLPGIIPNITPVNGCLQGGTYIADIDLDWNALCPDPGIADICCFEGECEITVSGSSASCITIIEQTGTRVIFQVDGACPCGVGVVCFDINCVGFWVCCTDECAGGGCGSESFNQCPCQGVACNQTTQVCYDVCCGAYSSGFSDGFENNS